MASWGNIAKQKKTELAKAKKVLATTEGDLKAAEKRGDQNAARLLESTKRSKADLVRIAEQDLTKAEERAAAEAKNKR